MPPEQNDVLKFIEVTATVSHPRLTQPLQEYP